MSLGERARTQQRRKFAFCPAGQASPPPTPREESGGNQHSKQPAGSVFEDETRDLHCWLLCNYRGDPRKPSCCWFSNKVNATYGRERARAKYNCKQRENEAAPRETQKPGENATHTHTHTHIANATLSAAPRPHAAWILIRLHELALDSILLHFALHVAENTFFLFRWALGSVFSPTAFVWVSALCGSWAQMFRVIWGQPAWTTVVGNEQWSNQRGCKKRLKIFNYWDWMAQTALKYEFAEYFLHERIDTK